MSKKSRLDFMRMKEKGEPAAWITAYDFPTASFAEQAGMDMILVGDSLGMVLLGYKGTVPVTMEECITCCKAVRRGAPNTFCIGDMPFMSYQISDEDAVYNAGRFLKEADMDAVKLEGGRRVITRIKAIADAGMLVMGHIGLTPQSSGVLGGFKAQGRDPKSARDLILDARAIEEAGAFSLLLEAVPPELTEFITNDLSIPVYSIGAGAPLRWTASHMRRYVRFVSGLHSQVRKEVRKRRRGGDRGLQDIYRGRKEGQIPGGSALLPHTARDGRGIPEDA